MKLSLVFVVALALLGAGNVHGSPVRSSSELNEIFQEFLALVPQEKVSEIFLEYLENDAEVQAVVEYVQSDAFRNLVKKVESIDDVINFYKYLHESGLDIYGLVNMLHEAIGLPPLIPGGYARNIRITGGIAGLIADIKNVLPIDKITDLYYEKLKTSPAFAQLVARLSSPKFQQLINALRANEEFQKIVAYAEHAGVNINHIKDLLASIFGLKFPSRQTRGTQDLNDDLHDFLALLPTEKISKIALDYLQNDPQVQEAFEYMQSDAFLNIVQEVEAMKEVKDVLAFIEESGVEAYKILGAIHEFLGIPQFKPFTKRSLAKASGGITGLIADIEAILPIDDIKALYYQKLENSLYFANLVKRLSSEEFQDFVNAILAKEEVRLIITRLKVYGVDLEAVTDLLSKILGLNFSKPAFRAVRSELHDDLDDFLALLPLDEITQIALNYVANDAQVQEAIEYMQSEPFHKIVQDVEAMQEAKDVLAFLEESGLEAYKFLNGIHDLLGIPPFKPAYLAKGRWTRVGAGIAGLIADIEAILPMDDMKALYYQKLENSLPFANLIKRLSSQEFQDFVDAFLVKDEALVIISKLKEHDVDLQAVADLLSKMLGLHFPKPSPRAVRSDLQTDLNDFIALLPIDEISEIAMDYVGNDAQVQAAIEYMQSEPFHKIVQDVEAMKEAKDVLRFLEESGLEAYKFLNSLHDLLGIPSFKPAYLAKRSLTMANGGIAGLIADIEAILPVDDLRALYYEKVKTSPAFSNLIKRLSSQEFQDFVDAVLAKGEAQVIINKLKEHNVDLQAIANLLGKMLGLHFPKPSMTRSSNELVADLKEFLNLLPLQEIMDIAVEYVFNDPDVQKAAGYIRTEEFKQLATAAQHNKEFKDFLKYLDQSGLPASDSINNINVFLGIPEVDPSALRRTMRVGGGVRGMLDAIEAKLPREQIKDLYEYKKQNSKAFSYFVERIEAPEFQAVIDKLSNNKDFQNLGYKAASFGIDLQAIVDFLQRVFGIEISDDLIPRFARSLEDDFNDFAALVPTGKIKRLAIKYAVFDKEVKALISWVRTGDFVQLVKDLESIPEYQDIITILEEAGVDVNYAINKIKGLIGLPTNAYTRWPWQTGGIAALLKDIKAVIPVNAIKALYKKKVQTSPEFAGFAKVVDSDKFQVAIDALFASNAFQDIVHRFQGHGINVTVIADFFFQFFGITTPHPFI